VRDFSRDHRWLSINTATLRGAGTLDTIIEACVRHGIRAISPWRDQVHAIGLERTTELVRGLTLELSGYCRGGMFPALDPAGRRAALDDNRRAVDEAKQLEATCLVLVVGGLPGALGGTPQSKDLFAARADVRDGIAATLEYARSVGMPLAIEPLHPMYCADRACVNTLAQALDLCDELDRSAGGALGVVVDAYHVWWDPLLKSQIERAGDKRLLAFHICDWLVPTTDLLTDRGMMGDGVIDLPLMRSWMEDAGYRGFHEVEILSSNNWWRRDPDEVLTTCRVRHQTAC